MPIHATPQNVDGVGERAHPAAEEQRHGDHGHDREAGVLVEVEHAEAHARVLGGVAGDQLGLGLGQVERAAVQLGDGGDVEDEEGERRVEADPLVVGLEGDDDVDAQRADDHGHDEQAEDHGDLVADHLGGGAQRADQRVLVARRPAAHEDRERREAGDGDEEDDADVEARRHEAAGVRDHELDGDGADHDHDRREREQHRVGEQRAEVLLAHHLEGVGDALQHALRTGAVGAEPVADEGHEAALEEDVDERRDEHHRVGDDDEEDGPEDGDEDVHLAVDASEHEVDAARDGHRVGDLVAAEELREQLQVAEAGVAELEPVRVPRPVALDVRAVLAARVLLADVARRPAAA